MMKFREKWFWALCLAILVHSGIFLIFYLNTNKTNTVEIADNGVDTADMSTAVSDITLPPTDKIYTTTVTSTKSLDNIDNSLNNIDNVDERSVVTKPMSNDEQTVNSENIQTRSTQTSNNIYDNSKKATPRSQEITQKNEASTQKNQSIKDKNPQPMVANSDQNLEEIKNNAGLLDIDIPTQKSAVQIDKDYLSAKSEVEEINRQLSAAINEVKKRNEQKIDERQQLKNEASAKGSQDFID
ncbi:hypothetical protein [Psychrobacter alimentarius]|uniref:hypothetical protein n=1 Tax=Psychrobacter alimentarius TaxID=261164 RepID=UPI003FD3108B